MAPPLQHNAAGLANDTDYLMSLIAVNPAGESAASNSVSITPALIAPDAPTIDSIAAAPALWPLTPTESH